DHLLGIDRRIESGVRLEREKGLELSLRFGRPIERSKTGAAIEREHGRERGTVFLVAVLQALRFQSVERRQRVGIRRQAELLLRLLQEFGQCRGEDRGGEEE